MKKYQAKLINTRNGDIQDILYIKDITAYGAIKISYAYETPRKRIFSHIVAVLFDNCYRISGTLIDIYSIIDELEKKAVENNTNVETLIN